MLEVLWSRALSLVCEVALGCCWPLFCFLRCRFLFHRCGQIMGDFYHSMHNKCKTPSALDFHPSFNLLMYGTRSYGESTPTWARSCDVAYYKLCGPKTRMIATKLGWIALHNSLKHLQLSPISCCKMGDWRVCSYPSQHRTWCINNYKRNKAPIQKPPTSSNKLRLLQTRSTSNLPQSLEKGMMPIWGGCSEWGDSITVMSRLSTHPFKCASYLSAQFFLT